MWKLNVWLWVEVKAVHDLTKLGSVLALSIPLLSIPFSIHLLNTIVGNSTYVILCWSQNQPLKQLKRVKVKGKKLGLDSWAEHRTALLFWRGILALLRWVVLKNPFSVLNSCSSVSNSVSIQPSKKLSNFNSTIYKSNREEIRYREWMVNPFKFGLDASFFHLPFYK